jgi:hypothetical protein
MLSELGSGITSLPAFNLTGDLFGETPGCGFWLWGPGVKFVAEFMGDSSHYGEARGLCSSGRGRSLREDCAQGGGSFGAGH